MGGVFLILKSSIYPQYKPTKFIYNQILFKTNSVFTLMDVLSMPSVN